MLAFKPTHFVILIFFYSILYSKDQTIFINRFFILIIVSNFLFHRVFININFKVLFSIDSFKIRIIIFLIIQYRTNKIFIKFMLLVIMPLILYFLVLFNFRNDLIKEFFTHIFKYFSYL
jgi:hypothetical protein